MSGKTAREKFRALISILTKHAALLMRGQPCLIALCAVLTGILPVILLDDWNMHVTLLLPIPGMIFAMFLFPMRDAFCKFVIPALIGSFVALCCINRLSEDPLKHFLGRSHAGAEIRIEITDHSCSGEKSAWLPVPRMIRGRVVEMRYSPYDTWRKTDAECMIRYRGEMQEFHPGYGDLFEMRGFFAVPSASGIEGAFDYPEYLRRKGINYVFNTKHIEFLRKGSGFRRMLFDLRGNILDNTVKSFRNDHMRSLAAGILFGFKQGIGTETKRDFIESGTIHILTVSGTHIGLFAAVLFLIFAFIPFRTRYMLIPFLTYFYALSTGIQGPAFRAFTMLLIFCLARAFLHSLSSFNSLMLSAILLLIGNPMNILDPGFQYSFLTVAMLLLSGGFISDWLSRIDMEKNWIPDKFISPFNRRKIQFFRWILAAFLGCLIAWLVSVALSLLYQGVFATASVFANIILLPVAWLCFMAFALTIIFSPFPFIPDLASRILEQLLIFMNEVCAIFAGSMSTRLPFAPLWTVFVFPLLLLILLLSRKQSIFFFSIGAMGAIIIFWYARPFMTSPEIVLLYGGDSDEPSFVISSPYTGSAVIVNIPDFESANEIRAYLDSKGIKRCSTLLLSGARKGNCEGVPYFLNYCKVERMVAPPVVSSVQQTLADTVSAIRMNGGDVFYFTREKEHSYIFEQYNLKTFEKKDFFHLETGTIDFNISIVYQKYENGTASVQIMDERISGNIASLELPNSFKRRLKRFSITEVYKKK